MLNIAIISVIIELVLIIFFPLIKNLFSYIVQREVFSAFVVDQQRGRNSFLINNIALSSFIFTYFLNKTAISNKNEKICFKLLIFFPLILTFIEGLISNVRTKFLQLLFLFISIIFVYYFDRTSWQISKRRFFLIVYIFLFSFFIFLKLYRPYNYNIIDRILISENQIDLKSINFRINSIERSLDLFKSNFLLGIGLGNYSFNDVSHKFFSLLKNEEENIYFQRVQQSPHNIFLQSLSETGLVGFLFLLFLLFYFIKQDIKIIKKNKRYKHLVPFVFSSWSYLIYGFFNPFDTLYVTGLFWFLRGFIFSNIN